MLAMQRDLLSLIREGRPRRVLFTTYTFSISWFETFILPALRKCGCHQIDVLVHSREERKSTDEATSLHAGTEFRVIPVNMQGKAIFHPKLTYMAGDSQDHLVVSSGNLTLSGYGKNLEVIDAVSSYQEPAVFAELAGFLDALLSDCGFAPENEAILRDYAYRARQIGAGAGDHDESARRTWLIHTLRNSAADQFAFLAERVVRPLTLTVLSPYHSPSGQPVQNLAVAVRAQNIRIGISQSTKTAPFEKVSMRFTRPVEYVVAVTEDAQRFPHAKCFELQGAESVLVMTGSVNATAQSLETTTNVEVALVRLQRHTPFAWESVEPDEYKACDFRALSQAPVGASVQATWLTSQRIAGRVFPAPGEMGVTLEVWDGEARLKRVPDVSLSEKGEFDARVADDSEYEHALRVILIGENLRVTGWLNVEAQLSASDAERRLLRAARRMRDGEFNIEDLNAVLAWLQALRAIQHPLEQSITRVNSGTQTDNTVQPQPVMLYDMWRRTFEDLGPLGASSIVTRVSLEAALAWLNSDLQDNDPATARAASDPTGGRRVKEATLGSARRLKLLEKRDEYFDDDDDEAHAQEAQAALFQEFVTKLPRGLEIDAKSALVPMIVELTGGAVLKRALAERAPRKADPTVRSELLIIDGWLTRYSKFEFSLQNREKLLPFFCAMACCAAHYHLDSSLEAVKEALQRVAGRAMPADEIEKLARMALHSRWLRRIPAADHERVASSAQVIGMCVTLSQVLEELIATVVTRPTERPLIPRVFEKIFGAVKQHRASKDKVFGNVSATSKACPVCYVTIKPKELADILAQRASLCTSCQRALFAGLDKEELAKKGLTGRFKG